MTHYLIDGPPAAAQTLVLAHGAGGAMDTPFMNQVAQGVAAAGVRVLRFEFPYMAARREGGRRGGAPDRQPVLLAAWREVVADAGGGGAVVIGGKSLGGRMASMIADEVSVRGLVCLGYPFHPPNNESKLRVEHLRSLRTPTLIVQGERDPFGTRDEVARYELSPAIRLEWLLDGDHSFKPRAKSGTTERENLTRAVEAISMFVAGLD